MNINANNKTKILRICIYVGLIFFTLSYYFSDSTSITRQSIEFWNSFFKGRVLHYYSDCNLKYDPIHMQSYANYDIILVFFMSIWQLPLYFIEKIVGEDIQRFVLARMYSKLFVIPCIIICENLLKKISIQMGYNKETTDRIGIMFISSGFVIMSSAIIGQVDIIGLVFILAAVYYFYKNDNIRFLLFYILAVQCKFFAFFIFAPLILYKERKIIKSGIIAGIPLVISFLISIPFKIVDPEGMSRKSERLDKMVEKMFGTRINLMGYTIPLLLVLYSLLVLVLFFAKKTEDKVTYTYIMLISASILFLNIDSMPYWFIYYVPFMLLLFFSKEECKGNRLLIYLISTSAAIFGLIFSRYWCFSAIGHSPVGQVIKGSFVISMSDLWMKYGHTSYYMAWTIVYGIFSAYMVCFLVFHCPLFKSKVFCQEASDIYDFKIMYKLYIIVNFLLVNICLWSYLIGWVLK